MKKLLLVATLLFADLSTITWLDNYPVKWVFTVLFIISLFGSIWWLIQTGFRLRSISALHILRALVAEESYIFLIPILVVRIGLFYVHETGVNYDSRGSGSYITHSFFSVVSFSFWSACLRLLQPKLNPVTQGVLVVVLFLFTTVALYTFLPALLMAMVLGFN